MSAQETIWNTVTAVLSEIEPANDNTIQQEAAAVYHYYSEMESGGHEALLNWLEAYQNEIDAGLYIDQLTAALETIGAHGYAVIEKKYGRKLWSLYKVLEKDESAEDEFYAATEKADDEYHQLNGLLENLLETYFARIHTELTAEK